MKKFVLLLLTAITAFGYISESRAAVINNYDDNGRLTEIITSPQIQRSGSQVWEISGTKYVYHYDEETGKKTAVDKYILRNTGSYEKTDTYEYSYGDGVNREFHYGYCNYNSCNLQKFAIETQTIALDAHGNEQARQHSYGYAPDASIPSANFDNPDSYGDGGLEYTKFEYYDESDGELNGKIKSETKAHSYARYFNESFTTTDYEYDSKTGRMTAKKQKQCYYTNEGNSFSCSDTYSTTTYEYDIFGNLIGEYMDNVLQTEHNYTDAYIAKQEQACSSEKNCIGCGNGRFLQEKMCVSTCGASFKLNDGECDRIRYTPAEAAKVLKDTDNEIIMTFKVNR